VFSELADHIRTHARTLRSPSLWSTRGRVFAALAVCYVALTVLVLIPNTPVLHLDQWILYRRIPSRNPELNPWAHFVVGFGQRWIITYILQLVFIWACFRARSFRPMAYFVTALVLLNGSVGVVKNITGRIGPAHQEDVHKIFVFGGDIYPSGHVSNAVIMFGVVAMAIPRYRRALIGLTLFAAVGVAASTIVLRTHWLSDIFGGWLAGALVLLAMPSVMPWADRFADQVVGWTRNAVHRRPRLHRVAHAVLAFGMRVIPADPDYWLTPAQRRARDRGAAVRGSHRAELAVEARRSAPEAPKATAAPAEAFDEFASWPATDASGRERSAVGR